MWTTPNILTALRLIAAPALAVMFLYFNRPYADWFALLLFIGAAITDWFDGFLARAWAQETKLGSMLDPIADKAMVVIALMVIVGYSSMSPWLVLPATVIMFREVFISGLREYLGEKTKLLKVTKIAKIKTSAQMVAIAILFSHGVFEHYHITLSEKNLEFLSDAMVYSSNFGLVLLWLAATLTLISGFEYLKKAWPYLKG
jgi:cardiolipin synthase